MPPGVHILLDYRPALRQRTGVGHYVHELASAVLRQLRPGERLTLFSSSWRDRLHDAPAADRVDLRIPVRLLNLSWHRLEWPPVEWLAGAVTVAHSAHPLLMPARRALQVVTVYDLDFLDHPGRTRAEIRRDYPALAGSHARRAALVVVISEHTAREVVARLGVREERLVLCRPGAPAWPSRTPPSTVGPIVFVGTIEPRKNLPRLFAAYARLVARRPDAPPLVLAGRRVEQSDAILATVPGEGGIRERVRHVGYVSDAEREQLYREASMLVLPSLEEGFGMTAVEAMRVGVPVVASRRGALPEVVGDAGILIDPEDEADLAAGMERLLDDPAQRVACAEAGQARARLFSWEDSAGRLLEAYREALARHGAGEARA
jgi:glycosyltransferase involved in cell wall biosynthesis